jgi:HK97 family phage prohead protease
MLEYKAVPTEFKASSTNEGVYEGYFSIFGNMDDGYDVIPQGAFAKTIQERAKRIKVFYAHDWQKLIGPAPDVLQEDSRGLYAKGKLTLASFWGNEVWQLMKDNALNEGSIGFETIPGQVDFRSDGARMLKEVKLYEISPVPLGMNPLTEVQAVKMLGRQSADEQAAQLLALLSEVKAGRVLSATNLEKAKTARGAMASAIEALDALIAAAGDDEEPKGAADLARLAHRLRAARVALARPVASRSNEA